MPSLAADGTMPKRASSSAAQFLLTSSSAVAALLLSVLFATKTDAFAAIRRPAVFRAATSTFHLEHHHRQLQCGFSPITKKNAHLRPAHQTSTTTKLAGGSSDDQEETFELLPSETALVLIEYQNEFTSEGGKLHDAVKDVMAETNMLANSAKMLNFARGSGCTVVHVPIMFEPGHCEIASNPYGILAGVKDGRAFTRGEWGAEICDVMQPKQGDLICKGKSGLCGFESTNLDFLLRQNGIKNVVLGGFLTNCCVESTMRSAYEKGYKVYTLKDCVAATSIEAQEATLEHNFGMFSIPTTSDKVMDSVKILSSA